MLKPHASPSDTQYLGLFSSIETSTAEKFIRLVCTKMPSATKKLHILFNSSGGSISAGFVLYNFIKVLPYHVIMHNVGSVDAIGIVVFLAGKERYSVENGTFLMHHITTQIPERISTESMMREKLSCIDGEAEKIKGVLAENSNLTAEQLDFKDGRLEDAQYALSAGIIHGIVPCPFPSEHFYLIAGEH